MGGAYNSEKGIYLYLPLLTSQSEEGYSKVAKTCDIL